MLTYTRSIMVILVVAPLFCWAQHQSLEDSLSNKTCECLSKIEFNAQKFDRDSLTQAMHRCFQSKEVQELNKRLQERQNEAFAKAPNKEEQLKAYGFRLNQRIKEDCEAFQTIAGRVNYLRPRPDILAQDTSCDNHLNGLYQIEGGMAWINDSFLVEVSKANGHVTFFKLKKESPCSILADFIQSTSSEIGFSPGDRMQFFVTKIDTSVLLLECTFKGIMIPLAYYKLSSHLHLHDFVQSLLRLQAYDLAYTVCHSALKDDPSNLDFLLMKAKIDYAVNPVQAIEFIDSMLATSSNLIQIGEKVSWFFIAKGNERKALQIINQLIALKPEEKQFQLEKAQIQTYLGNHSIAEKTLSNLLETHPDYLEALNLQALNYRYLGKGKELLRTCRKAIKLAPKDDTPLEIIAFYYLEQNQGDSAIVYFNKIINLNVSDQTKGRTLNNRAFANYKLGKWREATEDIKASLFFFPENSYAYKNLALIQIAENHLAAACVNLDKANQLGFTESYGDAVNKLIKKHCN